MNQPESKLAPGWRFRVTNGDLTKPRIFTPDGTEIHSTEEAIAWSVAQAIAKDPELTGTGPADRQGGR